jgi:hypothetical protein
VVFKKIWQEIQLKSRNDPNHTEEDEEANFKFFLIISKIDGFFSKNSFKLKEA